MPPEAPPRSDGLPETIRSISIQASTPAAGATKVLIIATAATPGGLERGAGVEAEPADPEQARADQGQSQASGAESLP